MSHTPDYAADRARQQLDEVEAALRRILADDRLPVPEDIQVLTGRLERLALRLGPGAASEADGLPERLTRIKRLHDALALRLTQQHAEASDRLAAIRHGKATLEAYGGNR
jgi:hypothetical protein